MKKIVVGITGADEANGAMIITSESITMIAGMYFFIYPVY